MQSWRFKSPSEVFDHGGGITVTGRRPVPPALPPRVCREGLGTRRLGWCLGQLLFYVGQELWWWCVQRRCCFWRLHLPLALCAPTAAKDDDFALRFLNPVLLLNVFDQVFHQAGAGQSALLLFPLRWGRDESWANLPNHSQGLWVKVTPTSRLLHGGKGVRVRPGFPHRGVHCAVIQMGTFTAVARSLHTYPHTPCYSASRWETVCSLPLPRGCVGAAVTVHPLSSTHHTWSLPFVPATVALFHCTLWGRHSHRRPLSQRTWNAWGIWVSRINSGHVWLRPLPCTSQWGGRAGIGWPLVGWVPVFHARGTPTAFHGQCMLQTPSPLTRLVLNFCTQTPQVSTYCITPQVSTYCITSGTLLVYHFFLYAVINIVTVSAWKSQNILSS